MHSELPAHRQLSLSDELQKLGKEAQKIDRDHPPRLPLPHNLGENGHGIWNKLPHKLPGRVPRIPPRPMFQPDKILAKPAQHSLADQASHYIPRDWLRTGDAIAHGVSELAANKTIPHHLDRSRPLDASKYFSGEKRIPEGVVGVGKDVASRASLPGDADGLKEKIKDKMGWFRSHVLGEEKPAKVMDRVKDYRPVGDWDDTKGRRTGTGTGRTAGLSTSWGLGGHEG